MYAYIGRLRRCVKNSNMNNDNDTIHQIEKLKALRASPEWTRSLRTRVLREINEVPTPIQKPMRSPYWSLFSSTPLRIASSGLFAFLFMISLVSQDYITEEIRLLIAEHRINNGSNAYERSLSSLGYADAQTERFSKSNDVLFQSDYLITAITTSQKELGGLKLMGEEGKYTQEQCLALYKHFDQTLDTANHLITKNLNETNDPAIQKRLNDLAVLIQNSINEAASRIELYPKKP